LGTCPKHLARYTTKTPRVLPIAFLFIRMMKKEKQAGPRTAPPPY